MTNYEFKTIPRLIKKLPLEANNKKTIFAMDCFLSKITLKQQPIAGDGYKS